MRMGTPCRRSRDRRPAPGPMSWCGGWWGVKLGASGRRAFAVRGGKWGVVRGAVRVTGETVNYLHANGDAVPSQPGPSASARPDVFMWAVIDWHFRTQRPQHLARGLMEAGHRVFYLSNNLV